LASRLCRWKLDVHSEGEYEKRQRESRRSLQRITGIGDLRAELLLADGYKSSSEVASTAPAEIAAVLDVTEEEAAAYIASAKAAAERERVEKMVTRIASAVADAAEALRAAEAEAAAAAAAAASAAEETAGDAASGEQGPE
jgi:hypothetical protein